MRQVLFGAVAPVLFAVLASSASAQTVREFLETADRIPRNPMAMFHPATRRLMDQLGDGVDQVRLEQAERVSAGQPRTICVPDRVPVTSQTVLERFQSIPPARRGMTVNQAMREWMAERYPCAT